MGATASSWVDLAFEGWAAAIIGALAAFLIAFWTVKATLRHDVRRAAGEADERARTDRREAFEDVLADLVAIGRTRPGQNELLEAHGTGLARSLARWRARLDEPDEIFANAFVWACHRYMQQVRARSRYRATRTELTDDEVLRRLVDLGRTWHREPTSEIVAALRELAPQSRRGYPTEFL